MFIHDMKIDLREPIGGWASGEYLHRSCSECGEPFIGAKRATKCAPCAYLDKNVIKGEN